MNRGDDFRRIKLETILGAIQSDMMEEMDQSGVMVAAGKSVELGKFANSEVKDDGSVQQEDEHANS